MPAAPICAPRTPSNKNRRRRELKAACFKNRPGSAGPVFTNRKKSFGKSEALCFCNRHSQPKAGDAVSHLRLYAANEVF